jgi:hypothetical protein
MPLTMLLRCNNLEETRRLYQFVPGFAAFGSADGTLTVDMEGNNLIFTPSGLWGHSTELSGTIYLSISAVDSYFSYLQGKVDVVWPIQDMPYGSREFGIKNCNGYHLAFQQQV